MCCIVFRPVIEQGLGYSLRQSRGVWIHDGVVESRALLFTFGACVMVFLV